MSIQSQNVALGTFLGYKHIKWYLLSITQHTTVMP